MIGGGGCIWNLEFITCITRVGWVDLNCCVCHNH